MAKKTSAWKTKGMNRDLSVSAFNPEFAFENVNLRLATNDHNTLMSWVNEKGPAEIPIYVINPHWSKNGQEDVKGEYADAVAKTLPHGSGEQYAGIAAAEGDGWSWRRYDEVSIEGIPVGTAVINHQLVLFTTDDNKTDRIYVLWYSNPLKMEMEAKQLFEGNLNFSSDNPLETLVSYESENIQKVYWVDGRNQPRLINIKAEDEEVLKWHDIAREGQLFTMFDFVNEMQLQETVMVKKILGASGMFAPGVIQYAFTYYKKYGQETNIFYTTPLYYISHKDRGASPEDKVDNAFRISVFNVDTDFDYLRIYSIQRTSINATPICKRIQDISLKDIHKEALYVDRVLTKEAPLIKINGEYVVAASLNIQPSEVKIDGSKIWCKGFSKANYPDMILKCDNRYLAWGEDATAASRVWIPLSKTLGTDKFKVICAADASLTEITPQYMLLSRFESADINYVEYTDTGTSGDSIDPMELLYKGGRTIIANTMEQKDNTLFFGNFSLEKAPYEVLTTLQNTVGTNIHLEEVKDSSGNYIGRKFKPTEVSSGSYKYSSQLTSVNEEEDRTVPCGGFKTGDYYRFGVQFQYKTGEWSAPIYTPVYAQEDTNYKNPTDFLIKGAPSIKEGYIKVPAVKGTLSTYAANELLKAGYKRIRPVVVFPEMQDRVTICQGVVSPTLYTEKKREDGGLTAQSSWFFRCSGSSYPDSKDGTVAPYIGAGSGGLLEYTQRGVDGETGNIFYPNNLRRVEIQGDYNDYNNGNSEAIRDKNKFRVDQSILTFHSPDIEFDTKLSVIDLSSFKVAMVGSAEIKKTVSDIDIQTETPTISNSGNGFIHKTFKEDGPYGIVSGLFYDDMLADDNKDSQDQKTIMYYAAQHKTCKWMVYLWNKSGSLNNDFTRPANMGVQSAKLKKKVISNLRYAETSYLAGGTLDIEPGSLQLFSSDNPTILKWKKKVGDEDEDRLYQGNIDTLITPNHTDGMYFCLAQTIDFTEPVSMGKNPIPRAYYDLTDDKDDEAKFDSEEWWKTFNKSEDEGKEYGPRRWNPNKHIWEWSGDAIGDDFAIALNLNKESVRIKYKSTPHYVFESKNARYIWTTPHSIPIVEIRKDTVNHDTIFGGKSDDALKENIWIPCGEPVFLGKRNSHGQVEFEFSYGDTYYQRWDCLKTYAYTPEDINQVVEIGSFMLESRVNIDGRYDRNRGQISNINMSPTNFNLLNPVYSQTDNFFQYRIQDEEDRKNTEFPNQIAWSKTKTSGADVDLYTNVTLASVLEMDGDKGEVRKLIRFNDQLISFQDKGIAQVLYNENMQMSTTEGVPIEIANSGKVNGKRYFSDSIGCSNKWSMVQTPSGIYFMDSINKAIFIFNGQLNNLSGSLGFNTWAKNSIPGNEINWTPFFPESEGKSIFTSCYDKLNQDVLFINKDIAIAYSEKLGAFTSFYDYGNTPYFCSLDDTGIWLRKDTTEEQDKNDNKTSLWKHQAGDYCKFFGENKPFSMTLVGNPEPQTDKIFTNLEFRATVDGDGTEEGLKFIPSLPFDYLETWNEYQHGLANLENMRGHTASLHHTADMNASLKRKFRIWRCDIPRDNYEAPENNTKLNVFRTKRHPMDRMRNPWLYLKLMKNAAPTGESLERTEMHDILMTYFN